MRSGVTSVFFSIFFCGRRVRLSFLFFHGRTLGRRVRLFPFFIGILATSDFSFSLPVCMFVGHSGVGCDAQVEWCSQEISHRFGHQAVDSLPLPHILGMHRSSSSERVSSLFNTSTSTYIHIHIHIYSRYT